MDKKLPRKEFLRKRLNLSGKEVKRKSKIIQQKIIGLPQVINSNRILLYLSVNNEVETVNLIRYLQSLGKNIFLPAYSNNKYIIRKFVSFAGLEAGPYGILQPVNNSTMDAENLDLAILPGVAFDKKGVRLGYGKGVFDHLLKNFKGIKIGLAYAFQIVDKLSKEKHDLVVDLLVTDKEGQ